MWQNGGEMKLYTCQVAYATGVELKKAVQSYVWRYTQIQADKYTCAPTQEATGVLPPSIKFSESQKSYSVFKSILSLIYVDRLLPIKMKIIFKLATKERASIMWKLEIHLKSIQKV